MLSRRSFRMPLLEVFDRPEGVLSCSRRESSTTPTQSLSLLNSDFTRQQALADTFRELPIWRAWPIEQFSPEENRLLSFAYTYEDCEDPDLAPAAAWERLQKLNQLWNAEVFEGLVAKKLDSTYPRQLRSPNLENPYWIKHRWEF
jgi:hypothetical protein